MNNVSNESIKHRDEEVEYSAGVDVTDVDMPFLADFRWLDVACTFLAWRYDPAI
jgi:hypothetical protein